MRIETPCVGVCGIDDKTDLCSGCGRTLPELAKWSRFTDEERRDIMNALPQRMRDAGLKPPE